MGTWTLWVVNDGLIAIMEAEVRPGVFLSGSRREACGGFYKLGVFFAGVPLLRALLFGGLPYWGLGPLIFGKSHIAPSVTFWFRRYTNTKSYYPHAACEKHLVGHVHLPSSFYGPMNCVFNVPAWSMRKI